MYQEKFDQREAWHKLVVKVISWKEGISDDNNATKFTNKITAKEWTVYSKRLIQTNISSGREKVLASLKEIRQIIQKHGGFE